MRQVEAAACGVSLEQLAGKVRDVLHQALQRITARPQRPNDFLQRPHGLAGRLRDFLRVGLDLARVILVRPRQVAQERDAGERGAQIVVQILRDARSLALQGPFLLQQPEPALVFSLLQNADRARDGSQQPQRGQPEEPPRLPEMRQHDQEQARPGFVPAPAAVAGGHMKPVLTRRHVTVKDRTPGPGLDPVRIQRFEPIAETHPLRRTEVHARVPKFQPVFARRNLELELRRRGAAVRALTFPRSRLEPPEVRLHPIKHRFLQHHGRGERISGL